MTRRELYAILDAKKEDILAMYDNNVSARQIAISLGVKKADTIIKFLRKHDKTIRGRIESTVLAKKLLSPEQELQVVALRKQGKKYKEISSLLGIAKDMVNRTLKRHDATRHTSPRRVLPIDQQLLAAAEYATTKAGIVAAKYDISVDMLRAYAVRHGQKAKSHSEAGRSCSLDETVFDDPLSEHAQYFVGLLMADGTVNDKRRNSQMAVSLPLGIEDREMVDKFKTFLKSGHKITESRGFCKLPNGNIVPRNMDMLTVTSDRLANKLISFGVVPRKETRAKVIGLETSRHFWRGEIDGDGDVGLTLNSDGRYRPKIGCVGTLELMTQFLTFVRSIVPAFRGNLNRDHNSWALTVSGRSAVFLAEHLYGNCTIALARKWEPARMIIDQYLERAKTNSRYWMSGLSRRRKMDR